METKLLAFFQRKAGNLKRLKALNQRERVRGSGLVQGAIGQSSDDSAARHEMALEENLHDLAVIKGRPDPSMFWQIRCRVCC
jgi:hypothetical protein